MSRIARSFVAACSLYFAAPADAAAVYLTDRDEPVVGFLVSQDQKQVVIEQVRPDGSRHQQAFDRRDVDEVVMTVSKERLGGLDHHHPASYREYAEELAEYRKDPEAREMAMRLFMIAAYLDSRNLGNSCMLGLIDLARDRQEEAKFRAMAYLLDANHDPRMLKPPAPIRAAPRIQNDSSRDLLITSLQNLRQGNRTEARNVIDQNGVRQQLDQFYDVITYDEFIAACSQERISAAMLRKMLLLELALQPQTVARVETQRPPAHGWREAVRRHGLAPVPALSLENMTRFDPRQCHYRNDTWIEPDDLRPK